MRGKRTVFIGHAASDALLARRLKEAIASSADGRIEVFVSSDLDSIKAGEDWLARIIDRLRGCRVVIAIITPNTTTSPWVHYEVGVADASDPLVIPVAARGGRLSDLPAPLGRRQGRNLAKPDDLRALVEEVVTALGVGRSRRPTAGLSAVLREARRPALGGRLSFTALRIAELLSVRSERALEWDPSLDAEDLRLELDVDTVSFLAAVSELTELGWLLSRAGSVGPAEEFFVDAEAALGASDPREDARRIATIVARRPREVSRVEEIAAELGWIPRRMNAALHALHRASPEALVATESPGRFAYVLVLPDGGILRLARGSGIRS